MFEYVLPVPPAASRGRDAATKPDGGKPGDGGGPRKEDRDRERDKPRDPGQIQTQMVGEKPGDDLGYDPRIIPTEKIPD